MNNYLFVYGSLRSKAPMGDMRSKKYGLELVCDATVKGFLYDFGSWPGAVFSSLDNTIYGEYVIVNDTNLKRLDIYESVKDNLFERIKIQVSTQDGLKTAYTYQVSKIIIEQCHPKLIESGDWLLRK